MTSGDTIIYDYKGDIYSDRVTTTSIKKRFYSTSKRLRTLQMRNSGATYNALIGDYNVAFATNAYTLKPDRSIWFENVDIYDLAYYYSVNYTTLELIGVY